MIPKYEIILASQSPRRQQLLKEMGWSFTIQTKEIEEIYPLYLKQEHVALHLAQLKADAFENELKENTLVITADTIVCIAESPDLFGNEKILGKPNGYDEAVSMLKMLSGKKHVVITAVCLKSKQKQKLFYASTDVYFKHLTEEEIRYYVSNYKPFDKAGAYGAQEWLGFIGIEKIEGSYFNVMGLPTKELYEEMLLF